mmetsp:Transcript_19491/g.60177  ORF Transcript_19491/g.60177 Transcript_19491/m.60177 type:complete len:210 (+) Transcript_19491:358-987(+)
MARSGLSLRLARSWMAATRRLLRETRTRRRRPWIAGSSNETSAPRSDDTRTRVDERAVQASCATRCARWPQLRRFVARGLRTATCVASRHCASPSASRMTASRTSSATGEFDGSQQTTRCRRPKKNGDGKSPSGKGSTRLRGVQSRRSKTKGVSVKTPRSLPYEGSTFAASALTICPLPTRNPPPGMRAYLSFLSRAASLRARRCHAVA